MWKAVKKAVDFLKSETITVPQAGIILGTGLGRLIKEIRIEKVVPYSQIPYFPVSTVHGHSGNLVFGSLSGKRLVVMQGRFHYYEGYTMNQLSLPVRIMHELGIKLLILSNASGGVNPDFHIGDMMIVTDHINLMQNSLSIGRVNDNSEYQIFCNKELYLKEIISISEDVAIAEGIPYKKGVLAAVTGPCFETPAEYQYIRRIGADAVGMSIIPEVITAKELKLPCLAFSIISDLGVPGKIVEVTHEDVINAASQIEPKMSLLIRRILETSFMTSLLKTPI